MRRRLFTFAVPLVTFAVALAVFGVLSRQGRADEPPPVASAARIATEQGEAALQKARETADPSFYRQAEALFTRAHRGAPKDADPLVGLGTLALARHDFREALRLGQQAHRLAPELVRPYAVVVDAQVELGRYRDAARSLQRMVDLKPNLASYARVSYFRELHGDLDGAVEAMRLAVSAGGGSAESVAYVQTLLGNLELARGRSAAAGRAYATALARFPGYVPAIAGRARLDASRGRLDRAIAGYKRVTDRLPLPEYVIALGEAELANGDRASARERFALVDAERRLLSAAGVNTDVEFALFEADHGDGRRGVALGRRAWRDAPSVRSADALGWALTRAGRPDEGLRYARRALSLGSRDPSFLVHAGLTARAAHRPRLARRWLAQALADNPRFSPLWAPRARRALQGLDR